MLIDSYGDGWSIGSKLIISSESRLVGEFTFSGRSSIEILFHPILGHYIGMIDNTIITDCSLLGNIPTNTISLSVFSVACNFESLTELNLSNYDSLESIEVGSNSLMNVNLFVIDGLNELKSLKIGYNSFTKALGGHDNDSSRSFQILNCAKLESIDIESFSFSDYGGLFELDNLPNLITIKMSTSNFYYSSFVIKSIIDMILLMNRSSTFEFY